MNYPIVRLYATAKQAADATHALAEAGFTSDLITTVSPTAGAAKDTVARAIAAGYVLKSEADQYAQGVLGGRTALIVRAVFGTGGQVGEILDAFHPVPSPVRHAPDSAGAWDEATPISCAFRAPLLSEGFFSTFWSLPLLTRMRLRLPFPQLTESRSKTVLSKGAAPLSAMLRIPLLVQTRRA